MSEKGEGKEQSQSCAGSQRDGAQWDGDVCECRPQKTGFCSSGSHCFAWNSLQEDAQERLRLVFAGLHWAKVRVIGPLKDMDAHLELKDLGRSTMLVLTYDQRYPSESVIG